MNGRIVNTRTAVLLKPCRLVFEEGQIDLNEVAPDEIVAQTIVSVISPGTEIGAYEGAPQLRPGTDYPRVIGYCNVASILAVGNKVKRFKPDDLVLSFQSHRTRFSQLLMLHDDLKNEAGKLARSLISVMDSLWVFLDEQGVDPTNNWAERALRFGVISRTRCFGSQSVKGDRWVERILSLKETCRLKFKSSFFVLSDLMNAYFKDQKPNLAWIA